MKTSSWGGGGVLVRCGMVGYRPVRQDRRKSYQKCGRLLRMYTGICDLADSDMYNGGDCGLRQKL